MKLKELLLVYCMLFLFVLWRLASSENIWNQFHLPITELFISLKDSREEEAPCTVVTGAEEEERKVVVVADTKKSVWGEKNMGTIIYVNSVFLQVTSSFVIRCKGTLL